MLLDLNILKCRMKWWKQFIVRAGAIQPFRLYTHCLITSHHDHVENKSKTDGNNVIPVDQNSSNVSLKYIMHFNFPLEIWTWRFTSK